MRRILLLALLLAPALAGAQGFIRYHPPVLPLRAATGCATPSFSFTADTNAGMCITAANTLIVSPGANSAISIGWLGMSTTTGLLYFYDAGGLASGFQALDASSNIFVDDVARVQVTAAQTIFGSSGTEDRLIVDPVAKGAGQFDAAVTSADLTAAQTWTFPNATGDVAVTAAAGFPARTAAATWAARTITAGTGGAVTNGDGVAGNPTVGPDLAVVDTFSSGVGDVPATGAVGTFFSETDALSFYTYPALDTEHWLLSIAPTAGAGRLFQTSAADVLAEITSTDDNTLVSDGATWAKKALPNGPLTYATASNTFSQDAGLISHATDCTAVVTGIANDTCIELDSERFFTCQPTAGGCDTAGEWILTPAAGGAAAFDPGTTFEMYEELIGGYTGVAGTLGETGIWSTTFGGGAVARGDGEASHPGILNLVSHVTADNSGASMELRGDHGDIHQPWSVSEWSVDIVFRPGTSGAITNSVIACGIMGDTTVFDSQNRGIWAIRDTDRTHTAFVFQICDSVTSGCQSAGDDTNSNTVLSSITPTANTWYRLRARRLTSGVGGNPTIYMRINDETEKTFCTSGCDDTLANLPPGIMVPSCHWLTRTTTGVVTASLDYFYVKITGMTRY